MMPSESSNLAISVDLNTNIKELLGGLSPDFVACFKSAITALSYCDNPDEVRQTLSKALMDLKSDSASRKKISDALELAIELRKDLLARLSAGEGSQY